MKAIGIGSKGKMVESVQSFLRGRGFDVLVDGSFGKNTLRAVTEYQQLHSDLTPDGWIGNSTLTAMLKDGLALLDDTDKKGGVVTDDTPKPPFDPLASNAARGIVFGQYEWVPAPEPGNREAIRILGDWESENIATIIVPVLAEMGFVRSGMLSVHKKVAWQVTRFFQTLQEAGLAKHIVSFDGGYVPRLVRGSRTVLSNHAFGSAFDLNAEYNQLGAVPAKTGHWGSVRELVRVAHEYGLYWGGHFRRSDGMHFEVSVVLPTGKKLLVDYENKSSRMVAV